MSSFPFEFFAQEGEPRSGVQMVQQPPGAPHAGFRNGAICCRTQSRQNAKLFSSRLNWIETPPTPHPQASVPSPPLVLGGGAHSLAREGGGTVPIPMRGHTLWYSVLCAEESTCETYRQSSTTAFRSAAMSVSVDYRVLSPYSANY